MGKVGKKKIRMEMGIKIIEEKWKGERKDGARQASRGLTGLL